VGDAAAVVVQALRGEKEACQLADAGTIDWAYWRHLRYLRMYQCNFGGFELGLVILKLECGVEASNGALRANRKGKSTTTSMSLAGGVSGV